jgi:hypothetical protein
LAVGAVGYVVSSRTVLYLKDEAIEFLGKVDGDPLFSLKKYKDQSYNIMSLMDRYIDSLTSLVGDNKEQLVLHFLKFLSFSERNRYSYLF